ncbi:MAG: glycosyltransferase involved in cell wall biosynthesis [Desulforhopalus sp.]|jgi:glycosyltransferase involved in cell wall biosynthesis
MSSEKSHSPLISVIIPAYNHEKFIGAAVDSVLGQTIEDLELIVINDGSTDRTGEIVQRYDDPRISYYYQENQDAFNTINRGLSLVKGEFVAILNSDDVYTKDRFEKMLEFQKIHKSECVITDVIPISDSGKEFHDPAFGWNIWHQKNRDYFKEIDDVYAAFLKGNFMVTTSNLFMTASAAAAIGKFCSLRYLHDYDYIFRMMLMYPEGVHYMENDKLLYYRIHDGNTLGEAAILGREQDQDLISKYTAEKIPAAYRMYAKAGAERLVELGNELHEVRTQLTPVSAMGVVPAAKMLLSSLKVWVGKRFK